MGAAGGCRIVVGSLAEAVPAPPPETPTWFVTSAGASAPTLTVTMIAEYEAPGFSASLRVQELPEQLQPVPAIETGVRPEGIVSVTVTVPLVARVPVLRTTTE